VDRGRRTDGPSETSACRSSVPWYIEVPTPSRHLHPVCLGPPVCTCRRRRTADRMYIITATDQPTNFIQYREARVGPLKRRSAGQTIGMRWNSSAKRYVAERRTHHDDAFHPFRLPRLHATLRCCTIHDMFSDLTVTAYVLNTHSQIFLSIR